MDASLLRTDGKRWNISEGGEVLALLPLLLLLQLWGSLCPCCCRVRASAEVLRLRCRYANLQSVCSVDHALWADPWCTMSPGPVRRAARRSEMQIMFAVREGSRSL